MPCFVGLYWSRRLLDEEGHRYVGIWEEVSGRKEGRCEGMYEMMQWRGGTFGGLISIEVKDHAVAASPTVAARARLYKS